MSFLQLIKVVPLETRQTKKLCSDLKSLTQNIKPQANNLGMLFDPHLNFDALIIHITGTAFYHLRKY